MKNNHEADQQNQEKDDLGRAFAKLEARNFPDKRNPFAKPKGRLKAEKLPEDEEAALFLQAVGAARPLEKMEGLVSLENLAPKLKAEKEKLREKQAEPKQKVKTAKPDPEPLSESKNSSNALTIPEQPAPEEDTELARLHKEFQDVTPLQGKSRIPAPPPLIASEALVHDPLAELQALVDGTLDFALSGTDEFMEGHVVGLDLLTVAKLQARHYSPEGHIDLHGLNSQQAFSNLIAFVRDAYQRGKRTLLVVTGRGKGSPDGNPVLRNKVQEWFTQDPFRRVVLAFCSAKREDGGPGALYVLLRKHKKKQGKVRWDRMPSDPDLFIL